MKTSLLESTPKLAAPGAGLPWLELQIARLIFRSQLRGSNRESAGVLLAAECREILQLAAGCSDKSGAQRVLIKRLPGMEDSSRNWSVFMTMEHLCIVNEFIASTIASLGRGETPAVAADTAAVKPHPAADAAVRGRLEKSCGEIAGAVRGVADLHTPVRHPHPWFGPLDAAAWYFMAGFHMRLHRTQIGTILRGLAKSEK
ncbi:MAG: DinB family protein [Terrimicrobiaceae bacterium]